MYNHLERNKSYTERRPRLAWTLVEVLVVIAIVAVLLGLLLPALAKIRETAAHLRTKNQLRQLGLGLHQYVAANDNRMPGYKSLNYSPEFVNCPIELILPYVDEKGAISRAGADFFRCLVNANDPSYEYHGPGAFFDDSINRATSFVVNPNVFYYKARFPDFITDGTSHTIAFSQHYANCGGEKYASFLIGFITTPHLDVNNGNATLTTPIEWPSNQANPISRRPTFSDPWYSDLHPMNPLRASRPPFQIAPRVEDCDPRVAQTPHQSLSICLADGSVRSMTSSVSQEVYWALVTSTGGEVAGAE